MAVLSGRNYRSDERWVEIVTPDVNLSPSVYTIKFGPDWSGATVMIPADVTRLQFGHDEFNEIALAFRNVDRVSQYKEIGAPEILTPALFCWSFWLYIVLSDTTTRLHPENITLQLFVSDPATVAAMDEDPLRHPERHRYIRFGLNTTIQEAHRFGLELQSELRASAQRRIELGIAVDGDKGWLESGGSQE